ncbi:MAG: anti-sigma factor antagonist [Candidatus Paraimprobicoccus trichonymphae]|uniref:Anti-sigma factor antagonist n=1 Tax=Candidatus Paraimprobicoccus trichonymphae TaxID=3033793 RepID=A0AA48HW10_9FIRM|nr:MAG: anti-sigma factor antagonist [Candidatus Paraimprobicoccus trichonymphae]
MEVNVDKKGNNGIVIFNIKGRLDTKTSPEFQKIIEKNLKGEEKNFIFNFDEVEYLSSAGLRVILSVKKMLNNIEGSSLSIRNVNDNIMEIFDMTGFTEFLNIY